LRATGSRECAPDDRLREAIHVTAAPGPKVDCFVASAPRNDAAGVAVKISNRRCASALMGMRIGLSTSLRATGSRECAPDDRLREAIHLTACWLARWIASSQGLLAMTLREFRFEFQTADARRQGWACGLAYQRHCFAALAMTWWHFDSNFKQQIHVRLLAARPARGLHVVVPPRNEGAGNAGCALHPRSRVQNR
jgi:hypothetical protein